jgi:SAM-dependent methyltransferase
VKNLTLDSPQPRQRVHDQAITVSGSIQSDAEPQELSVWCNGECIGSTRIFGGEPETGYRFRLLAGCDIGVLLNRRGGSGESAAPDATLTIRARFADDRDDVVAEVPVVIIPARLHERAYGEVLSPDRADVLHRENIYGSGPPIETPSGEVVQLLLQLLRPRSSVVDVGCGAGAYGPPLVSAGYHWLGAEVDPACIDILTRRGLPFRKLQSGETRLPFEDAHFDAAIAVEVIEHITDLDSFVAELARVTRSRLLVSVPNMEVIPYFAPLGVVPWHLLEATHVNFFTRASLRACLQRHFARVEVFSYAEHPVRTHEGIPVHLHLFAVASK